MLIVEKDYIPNVQASTSVSWTSSGGRLVQKLGNDSYLLLPPTGQSNVIAGRYYLAVVSVGQNPTFASSRSGTGTSTATLTSLGVLAPIQLGTLSGPDLTQAGAILGGETQPYQFTIPANTLAVEVWLENRVGNPLMTLVATNRLTTPTDTYGYDGGQSTPWQDPDLITLHQPASGVYTLHVQAAFTGPGYGTGSIYSNATYTVRVRRVTATPLAFDGGSVVQGPGQRPGTWRYYSVQVPANPNLLGWDVRITNAISGKPQLVIRRDSAPGDLGTHTGAGYPWYAYYSTTWPSDFQWGASLDWTGYQYDGDGTNRYGQVLQMGIGNPLEPGNYIIGVFQSGNLTDPELRYAITSRGIGTGFSIPVTALNFAGGSLAINNLPARESAYFKVVVPTNTPNWKVRLSTNSGECLLILQKDALGSISASSSAPTYLYGGRKLQKATEEVYTLFPEGGNSNVVAGTYYLSVVSEGLTPQPAGSRLGTNTINATITSVGSVATVDLGMVAPGSDIAFPDKLIGGDIQSYRFTVSPGTLSLEVRLEAVVGSPNMTLRADGKVPLGDDAYGRDNGESAQWRNPDLILIANPTNAIYTLSVQARVTGPSYGGSLIGYSNTTYAVRVHAVGATPLAFDGGSITISGHQPGTWRYFLVTNVPPNALGWDLRLIGVTGGNPHLSIRRETLPDNLVSHTDTGGYWYYPTLYTNMPPGWQLSPGYDLTGDPFDFDGSDRQGKILQVAMGNPLSPGNYYIGVINSTLDNTGPAMTYTLSSRGIGAGFSIPVTPLPFSGSVSNTGLAVRDVAYYAVDVPANTPSWKVRLAVGTGESTLIALKDFVPGVFPVGYPAADLGGGFKIQKSGNEQFALLTAPPADFIPAGRYYLSVVSEGRFPVSNRAGTNQSTFLIQSQGALPVIDLGSIGAGGVVRTNLLECGELRVFRFSVPSGTAGLEVRLDERVGNPGFVFRRGLALVRPNSSYGLNYGQNPEWSDDTLVTLSAPVATNYSLSLFAYTAGATCADASSVLRIRPTVTKDLAFDPLLEGCSNGNAPGSVCTNATDCSVLGDNERRFYRVQIPSQLPDTSSVIGWELRLSSNAVGQAQFRVRQLALPSDAIGSCNTYQSPWYKDAAILAPPYLTNGLWYVEVRGVGQSGYCLTSRAVRLQRPSWTMPALGQPIITPGLLAGPYFADSGVSPSGIAAPGDGGIDLEQGAYHFFALSIPPNNGGVLRVILEAISGNPDAYFRPFAIPSSDHDVRGGVCQPALIERRLTGNTTEYGNFVPDQGRYESGLTNGLWFVSVKANGNSNCRYRLRLSTGQVADLALNGSVTNQTIAGGDWRYYRFYVPSNAPIDWTLTFQQTVGDVVMYVRDTVPPGQFSTTSDLRDWRSNEDSKNHGVDPSYQYPAPWDPAGSYTLPVSPVRPGHTYYVGFQALKDATFAFTSATNPASIGLSPYIPFYSGTVTNFLAPGERTRYRIHIPADATRWVSRSIHSASVKWWLDQGSLPTETFRDHSYSSSGQNGAVDQYLLTSHNYPWSPSTVWYLSVSNGAASSQPFSWTMDGRNCASDDADKDGLPDCWEVQYFGNTYQVPNGDPDGDGNSNLTEYLDGTDPTDPQSMLARLTLVTVGPGAAVASPSAATYPWGTPVTLTATPTAPNVFYGWTGGGINASANPLVVLMTTNRTITAGFGSDYGPPGQTRADYRFQNTLASSVGTPPDLTSIKSGAYYTNDIVDGGVHTVLRWPQGGGLQLAPTVGVFPSNQFTIAILARFDSEQGWRRVTDSKNGSPDTGVYYLNGLLIFYPVTSTGATHADTNYHQIVLTRTISGAVVGYVDGLAQWSFQDNGGAASVSAAGILRFFKDDSVEETSGYVCRIRTWATPFPPEVVANMDRCSSPLILSEPGLDGANRLYFRITGIPTTEVKVDETVDFSAWNTIGTLNNFPGTVLFTNPAPANSLQKYYRARIP